MPFPEELYCIRHLTSELNAAWRRWKAGKGTRADLDILRRPSWGARLLPEELVRARTLGDWFRDREMDGGAEFCAMSPYARTQETALGMHLPRAEWQVVEDLRERDEVGHRRLKRVFKGRRANPLCNPIVTRGAMDRYAESMANVRPRIRALLERLEDCDRSRAILVTHSFASWALLAEIVGMTAGELEDARRDPSRKILNGDILIFSRRDPNTRSLSVWYEWYRYANPLIEGRHCPWRRLLIRIDRAPIRQLPLARVAA